MQRTDWLCAVKTAVVVCLTVFVVACSGTTEAPSESARRSNDPVSTAKPKGPWTEFNAPLPAYPRAENLAEFQIVGATNFKFFADLTSIRVDPDGVVRYSVVARSRSGAENVTFEGIHCEAQEYKVYAYGSTDGKWTPPRDPKWQSITSINKNDTRFSLYRYYICPTGLPPKNTKDAVRFIKRGRPYFDDYRKF